MTYKPDPRSDNPEHALLSEGLRDFVRGDQSGYASSTQSDYWKKINRRVWNTYQDFSLIYENLPEDRRDDILEIEPGGEEGDPVTSEAADDITEGLIDTVAFLYLLLEENPEIYGFRRSFVSVLESGVAKAVEEIHGPLPWTSQVDVELRVDENHIEPTVVDRVLHKIAEGSVSDLSAGELRGLILLAEQGEHAHSAFVDGWADIGNQIAEIRAERDDIMTSDDMAELAEMSEEESAERIDEFKTAVEESDYNTDE